MKYEDADALSVFRYCESIPGQPPAFLQCGGFVYPLVPGRSPVQKASDNCSQITKLPVTMWPYMVTTEDITPLAVEDSLSSI